MKIDVSSEGPSVLVLSEFGPFIVSGRERTGLPVSVSVALLARAYSEEYFMRHTLRKTIDKNEMKHHRRE